MEEIYLSIIRVIFGVVTLIGLLWCAVRYMIKYKIYRSERNMKDYTDEKTDYVLKKVHKLSDRVDSIEDKITK